MTGTGIAESQNEGVSRRGAGLVASICAMTLLLIGGSFALALDAGSAPMAAFATDDDPFLGTPGEIDVEELSVTRSILAKRPAQPAYVFTVRNDSTVASVEVARMSDAALGELNGLGTCVLPQTLAASELYTCHVNLTGSTADMPFAGVTVLARSESGAWIAGWARTPDAGVQRGQAAGVPATAQPTSTEDADVLGSSTDAPLTYDGEVLLID